MSSTKEQLLLFQSLVSSGVTISPELLEQDLGWFNKLVDHK